MQGVHRVVSRRAGGAGTLPVLVTDDGVFSGVRGHPALRRRAPRAGAAAVPVRAGAARRGRRALPPLRRAASARTPGGSCTRTCCRASDELLADQQPGRPGVGGPLPDDLLAARQALCRRELGIGPTTIRDDDPRVRRELDEVAELLADGRRYLCGERFTAADLTFAALAAAVIIPPGYGVPLPQPDELLGPARGDRPRASASTRPARSRSSCFARSGTTGRARPARRDDRARRRQLRGALLVSGRRRRRVARGLPARRPRHGRLHRPRRAGAGRARPARGGRGRRGPPPRRGARSRAISGRAPRSSCAATRATSTIRTRSRCTRPAAASRSAGCRASSPRRSRPSSTRAGLVGRRAARAAALAARPAHGPDDAARRRTARSSCARSAPAPHADPHGLDLALAVRALVDRARRADPVARAGQGRGPQVAPDVDHRDARPGDRVARDDHEVRVAVAVGIDALDVDDAAGRGRAVAGALGAAQRPRRRRAPGPRRAARRARLLVARARRESSERAARQDERRRQALRAARLNRSAASR